MKTWNKTGHTIYKSSNNLNLTAMQSDFAFEVFDLFFENNKIDYIIEIGTAMGGWATYLNDKAKSMNATFVTFDLNAHGYFPDWIKTENIYFIQDDIFKHVAFVKDIIASFKTVAIFCDGGDKVKEFNTFADLLKEGDYIFAHDYASTVEEFNQNIKGQYWDWCEIHDKPIQDAIDRNNIQQLTDYDFKHAAWFAGKKHAV